MFRPLTAIAALALLIESAATIGLFFDVRTVAVAMLACAVLTCTVIYAAYRGIDAAQRP